LKSSIEEAEPALQGAARAEAVSSVVDPGLAALYQPVIPAVKAKKCKASPISGKCSTYYLWPFN